jgi:hypothetical protein
MAAVPLGPSTPVAVRLTDSTTYVHLSALEAIPKIAYLTRLLVPTRDPDDVYRVKLSLVDQQLSLQDLTTLLSYAAGAPFELPDFRLLERFGLANPAMAAKFVAALALTPHPTLTSPRAVGDNYHLNYERIRNKSIEYTLESADLSAHRRANESSLVRVGQHCITSTKLFQLQYNEAKNYFDCTLPGVANIVNTVVLKVLLPGLLHLSCQWRPDVLDRLFGSCQLIIGGCVFEAIPLQVNNALARSANLWPKRGNCATNKDNKPWIATIPLMFSCTADVKNSSIPLAQLTFHPISVRLQDIAKIADLVNGEPAPLLFPTFTLCADYLQTYSLEPRLPVVAKQPECCLCSQASPVQEAASVVAQCKQCVADTLVSRCLPPKWSITQYRSSPKPIQLPLNGQGNLKVPLKDYVSTVPCLGIMLTFQCPEMATIKRCYPLISAAVVNGPNTLVQGDAMDLTEWYWLKAHARPPGNAASLLPFSRDIFSTDITPAAINLCNMPNAVLELELNTALLFANWQCTVTVLERNVVLTNHGLACLAE